MDRVVNHSIFKNRIFGLDFLRSLAMLCVIIAHSGYTHILGLRYGLIAVESFFVISGFLIGEMLLREFQTSFNLKNLKKFWVKRWFRTLPLYYFVLIIKFIFISNTVGWNVIWYFLFLQNNIFGIDFLPVSWTLVLEEWFYILMPVIFYILFKKGISGKKFFIFFIGFLVFSNLARLGWVLYTDRPFGAIVGNFPFRLDSFLIGVALAAVKIFYKPKFDFLANAKPVFFSSLFFIGLLYFFQRGDAGNSGNTNVWIRTVWFSLISISIALLLPFFTNSIFFNSKKDVFKLKWLITWLSLLSYPIYLIHVDVYHLLHRYLPEVGTRSFLIEFLINNVVVIILSILMYYLIHNPMLKLRSKIVKS